MENQAILVTADKPLTVQEIKTQINTIQQVMQGVMKGPSKEHPNGVHYGTVPGCGNKPTLLKPGAEKIMATFRLYADPQVDDLSTSDSIRYRVTVRLLSMQGHFVGAGIGECSSDEEKYKWRKAICDEEFEITPEDRRREKFSKSYGKVEKVKQVRTQPSDLANTILKMAKKRALVDAVLTATAASDIFDQDLEDLPPELIQNNNSNKPSPQKPQPKAQPEKEKTVEEEDKDFIEDTLDGMGVPEDEFLTISEALTSEDGEVINVRGKIIGIYKKKVGKDSKDITSYLVSDEDSKVYIGKWGTPSEGIEKGMEGFFFGCQVSSYNSKKQLLCEKVTK